MWHVDLWIACLLPTDSKGLEDRDFTSLSLKPPPGTQCIFHDYFLSRFGSQKRKLFLTQQWSGNIRRSTPLPNVSWLYLAEAQTNDDKVGFQECSLLGAVAIFVWLHISFICLSVRYPNFEFLGPALPRCLINAKEQWLWLCGKYTVLLILALKTTFIQVDRDHLCLPEVCVLKRIEENMQMWLWF